MITKKEADLLVQNHETFYRKDLEVNGVQVYIYNYLIADKEAFKIDKATELRGLTITHENGKERVFLSCPKFFNINEIEENTESNLQLKTIKKVTDKLDGSLISFVELKGAVYAKTKQSFTNIQAKAAQDIVDDSLDLKFFILDCWANNCNPLFELIGPDNKVVIDYEENELILVAVRHDNGSFIDVDKFNYKYTTKSFDLSLDEMIHSAKNDAGIEGYVVKFTDESIVKIKTLDYIEKHRLTDESDSQKIILKRILEEDMDDIYAIISESKTIKIRTQEQAVADYVNHFSQLIFDITKRGKTWERKAIAESYRNHEFFSVIMRCLNCDISDVKTEIVQMLLKRYNKENLARDFLKKITP